MPSNDDITSPLTDIVPKIKNAISNVETYFTPASKFKVDPKDVQAATRSFIPVDNARRKKQAERQAKTARKYKGSN